MRLLVDVDNTVGDMLALIRRVAEEEGLTLPIPEAPTDHDSLNLLLDHQWALEHCMWHAQHSCAHALQPIEHAPAVLHMLHGTGTKIVFVSHRPYTSHPHTLCWLQSHIGEWAELRLWGPEMRTFAIRPDREFDVLIDDRYESVEDIPDRRVLIHERPWNAYQPLSPNHRRFRSWLEVPKLLKEVMKDVF